MDLEGKVFGTNIIIKFPSAYPFLCIPQNERKEKNFAKQVYELEKVTTVTN
jgi:hypothetical protein